MIKPVSKQRPQPRLPQDIKKRISFKETSLNIEEDAMSKRDTKKGQWQSLQD